MTRPDDAKATLKYHPARLFRGPWDTKCQNCGQSYGAHLRRNTKARRECLDKDLYDFRTPCKVQP